MIVSRGSGPPMSAPRANGPGAKRADPLRAARCERRRAAAAEGEPKQGDLVDPELRDERLERSSSSTPSAGGARGDPIGRAQPVVAITVCWRASSVEEPAVF